MSSVLQFSTYIGFRAFVKISSYKMEVGNVGSPSSVDQTPPQMENIKHILLMK